MRSLKEKDIKERHGFPLYSKSIERKKKWKEVRRKVKELKKIDDKIRYIESIEADYWIPDKIRYPKEE